MKIKDTIVYSGDWHGDWQKVIAEIKRLDLSDCSIIQVGDFGAGFEHETKFKGAMRMLNSTLKSRNVDVFAIRGNHDNPIYFDNRKYGLVTLLKDYSILESSDTKILCVGGAISLDRKPNPEVTNYRGRAYLGRKEGKNYWTNENFVLNIELIKKAIDIDTVVTHSAPNFCYPIIKSGIETWIKYDNELEADVKKERDDLAIMQSLLPNVKTWYYGHYHETKREQINNTKYVLLDIIEFKM